MTRPTRILLWVAAVLSAVVVAGTLLYEPDDLHAADPVLVGRATGSLAGDTGAEAPIPTMVLATASSAPEPAVETRRLAEGTPRVVRGTVTDSRSLPVANAEVRVRCRLDTRITTLGPVFTDGDGAYRQELTTLADLARAEQHRVEITGIAEAQGLQATPFRFEPDPGEPGVWRGDVRLRAGTTFVGRVVDPARRPVARALVRVCTPAKGGELRVRRTGNTDDRGEFRIGAEATGNSFLLAEKQNVGRGIAQLACRGTLVGRDLGDVMLGGPTLAAGRVVDTEGRPVAGLTVRARPTLANRTRRIRGAPANGEARTDPDGRFAIAGMPVGAIRLEAVLRRPSPGIQGARTVAIPIPMHEPGDPDTAAYATGRTDLELVLPVHRLRVVVEDPTGRAENTCRVICIPERKLARVLPALATQGDAVPSGDALTMEYSVAPGDELALVAYVSQRSPKRKREAIRLFAREAFRVAQSPPQQTVTLRLKGD